MSYGIVIIATAVAMILVQRADAFEDLIRSAAGALRRCLREPVAPVDTEGGAEGAGGLDDPVVLAVPESTTVDGLAHRAP